MKNSPFHPWIVIVLLSAIIIVNVRTESRRDLDPNQDRESRSNHLETQLNSPYVRDRLKQYLGTSPPRGKRPNPPMSTLIYKMFLENPKKNQGSFMFLPPDKSPSMYPPSPPPKAVIQSSYPISNSASPPFHPFASHLASNSPSYPSLSQSPSYSGPSSPQHQPAAPPSPPKLEILSPTSPNYDSLGPTNQQNLSPYTHPASQGPPIPPPGDESSLTPSPSYKRVKSFPLSEGGCTTSSGLQLKGGEKMALGNQQCGARSCREFGGMFHLEILKCNVIVHNPNYTCVVLADKTKPFPECCPKFWCDD